ncbi:hypothetical protein FTX61_16515 [Nitriliruptoraceae bacterium ZYF776]|nr:hypothetical protein [Profundirhabdus halotolerans]
MLHDPVATVDVALRGGRPVGFEERNAWVMLVTATVAYVAYVAVVGPDLLGAADVTRVGYRAALLWAVGLSIVVQVAATVATSAGLSARDRTRDERDRAVGRIAEQVGQAFVVLAGVGALVLALLEVAHVWIANALYLGFTLSAVTASVTRIVGHRRGLPW